MKRVLTLFLSFILTTHLALIIYSNRAIFFSKFDEAYWKDKYEHSQWRLPLSVRTLGDDGLYLYEGYRLIKGGDPTEVNAEVPPLGKYLIGASILFFDNGYLFGFLTSAALLVTIFFLTKQLIKRSILALAATALLATDPLVTAQFSLTMLDSLQTLWLMLFLLLLTKEGSRQSVFLNTALAGAIVGFFAQTKFPPLALLLVGIGLIILWMQLRLSHVFLALQVLLVFLLATAAGYLLPYLPYFLQDHNVLDWLKVQKWIVSFYANAKVAPTFGSVLVTLLAGQIQNIFNRAWETSSHWSPSWTVIALISVATSGIMLFRFLKKRIYQPWLPVAALTLAFLIFYSFTPFWTRYLVVLLPLLYLLTILTIQPLKPFLQGLFITILLFANVVSTTPVFFPTAEATARQFAYNWENAFFQDMYEDLTNEKKTLWDRATFRRMGMQALYDAEIEYIDAEILTTSWKRFSLTQPLHLHLTYFTRNLGPFAEEKTLTLIKEGGRWRLPWEWQYLIDGFSENFTLETTVVQASRGAIIASDKKKLAEDFPSFLVWVTPGKIDKSREEEFLTFLETLFAKSIPAKHFHQRLVGNTPPDLPISLGIIPNSLDEQTRQRLLSYPGVSLTPQPGRIDQISDFIKVGTVANSHYFECCSWLYTTTTYDGIEGIEKKRNAELKGYNGGKLVIKDSQGNIVRTIIDLPKRDGQDVQL